MPYSTPSSMQPPKGALVVCAGTVTCNYVSEMGSGFMLFKKLFKNNTSLSGVVGGWQKELQDILDAFKSKKKAMPPYVRIAQQDGFIGGIATVAARSSSKGLTFDTFNSDLEREKHFREQYKIAVEQAILDAKQLKRPLFIQPLGIGVYGWKPKEAAKLFAEAIVSADPDNTLDITIPIFDQKPGSNDITFRDALTAEMAKKRPQPNAEKELGALQREPEPEHTDNRAILLKIVNTLITNIENKSGGRWTSGSNSKKVKLLEGIRTALEQEPKKITSESPIQKEYLQKIMEVCLIRRNPLHFWATPNSVNEYKQLLKENGLELSTARVSVSPKL